MGDTTMTTYLRFDANDADECPVHGCEVKREYTFGMEEADVLVYPCGHAACIDRSSGFADVAVLHPTYSSAAGAARLIVANDRAFTHRYGI